MPVFSVLRGPDKLNMFSALSELSDHTIIQYQCLVYSENTLQGYESLRKLKLKLEKSMHLCLNKIYIETKTKLAKK